MKNTFLSSAVAVIALLPFSLASVNAGVPEFSLSASAKGVISELESMNTKLPHGDLIEAIAFKKAFALAAPAEDCIVLPIARDAIGSVKLFTGCALYTKQGKVYVLFSGSEPKQSSELKPADLASGDISRLAKAAKAVMPKPTAMTAKEPVSKTLARARDLLHRHDADWPEVGGVVRARVFKTKTPPPGWSVGSGEEEMMAFDWADRHYFYHPAFGVTALEPENNAITGRPLMRVPNLTYIEELVTYHELKRQHPDWRVEFVCADTKKPKHDTPTFVGVAVLAYVEKGKLFFYSSFIGTKESPGGLTASAIDDHKLMYDTFTKLFLAAKDEIKSNTRAEHRGMMGDDRSMYTARAYRRLQEYFADSDVSGLYDEDIYRGVFTTFERRAINVLTKIDKKHILSDALAGSLNFAVPQQNRFIEGIVLAQKLRTEAPGETVAVVPYLFKGRKVKAITLYTRDGRVYIHGGREAGGDAPVAGVSAADLQKPTNATTLREIGYKSLQSLKTDPLRKKMVEASVEAPEIPYNFEPVSAPAVYKQLKAADIEATLLPTTRLRFADGVVKTSPVPCVVFRWQGVTYTYADPQSCTAGEGYIRID